MCRCFAAPFIVSYSRAMILQRGRNPFMGLEAQHAWNSKLSTSIRSGLLPSPPILLIIAEMLEHPQKGWTLAERISWFSWKSLFLAPVPASQVISMGFVGGMKLVNLPSELAQSTFQPWLRRFVPNNRYLCCSLPRLVLKYSICGLQLLWVACIWGFKPKVTPTWQIWSKRFVLSWTWHGAVSRCWLNARKSVSLKSRVVSLQIFFCILFVRFVVLPLSSSKFCFGRSETGRWERARCS